MPSVPAVVHHSAVVTTDVERSLAFWRDGIGMQVVLDMEFAGDWQTLLRAPTGKLRSIMLGDPTVPAAGVVELVVFDSGDAAAPVELGDGASTAARDGSSAGGSAESGDGGPTPSQGGVRAGFLLLSLYADLEATLVRLAGLGFDDVRRISQPIGGGRSVGMAVVQAPDGIQVELIDAGSAQPI